MLGIIHDLRSSRTKYKQPVQDETGATAVEYALLVAFIAAVIVVAVGTLGLTVQGLFGSVSAVWP